MANSRFKYHRVVELAGGQLAPAYMATVYDQRNTLRHNGIRTHRILDEEVNRLGPGLRVLSYGELFDIYALLVYSINDANGFIASEEDGFTPDQIRTQRWETAMLSALNRFNSPAFKREHLIRDMLDHSDVIAAFLDEGTVTREEIDRDDPQELPMPEDMSIRPVNEWMFGNANASINIDLMHLTRAKVNRIVNLSKTIMGEDPYLYQNSNAARSELERVINELTVDELYDICALRWYTHNWRFHTWEEAIEQAWFEREENKTEEGTDGFVQDLRYSLASIAPVYSTWSDRATGINILLNRLLPRPVPA